LTKTHVREIARQAGLPNHDQKDSVGICFVGKRKFKDFLEGYIERSRGRIIDIEDGKQMGIHDGISFYTIGQCIRLPGLKDRWYVASKNTNKNQLLVCEGHEHPALYSDCAIISNIHWINGIPCTLQTTGKMTCQFKLRYSMDIEGCTIQPIISATGTNYLIGFDTPQRAATPGQAFVLYNGDQCLGGGILLEASTHFS